MDKVCPAVILQDFADDNIESRPIWKPIHMQPVYAGYDYITNNDNVGEDIFTRGICLPSDNKNTEEDMERICNIIKGLF